MACTKVRLYLRDYERAMVLYEEGLKIRREVHDLQGIASSLNNLGTITFFQGDYQESQRYTEETLNISRDIGDTQNIAGMLSNLAAIAYYRKDFSCALELYKESLHTNEQLESKECIVICIEGIALILVEISDLEQAAVFFGAVAQLRESSGLFAYNQSHDHIIQTIDAIRRQLGDTWEICWNEGRSTPIDQIIASAFQL